MRREILLILACWVAWPASVFASACCPSQRSTQAVHIAPERCCPITACTADLDRGSDALRHRDIGNPLSQPDGTRFHHDAKASTLVGTAALAHSGLRLFSSAAPPGSSHLPVSPPLRL
ncbi:MAG: hypothetical protein HYZ89_07555 [Candidatus Omnitrophica bacterium]|nr:hypothetical protein [Candidatus Omnitrophota bacterium]